MSSGTVAVAGPAGISVVSAADGAGGESREEDMATETFRFNGGQATVTVEGGPASRARITINGQEAELGTGAGPATAGGTGSEAEGAGAGRAAAEGVSRVRLTVAADGIDNNVRVLLVAMGGADGARASGPRARASVRVSSTGRVQHHRGRRDDPYAPPGPSANHGRKP